MHAQCVEVLCTLRCCIKVAPKKLKKKYYNPPVANGQCILSEFLNDTFQFKCKYLKEYVIAFILYFQIYMYINI